METSRRELPEDVSFGIGTLLVCRVIEIGKPSKGVVICIYHIYTVQHIHQIEKCLPTRANDQQRQTYRHVYVE